MSTPWPKEEPPPNKFLQQHGDLCKTWVGASCDCGLDEVIAELSRLKAEVQDFKDYHRRVMMEECGVDEQHCGCVTALRMEIDILQKERDALLAMLNTNQARAQSAAQSAAKIAQDLQIYLREHTSDVVKLEV